MAKQPSIRINIDGKDNTTGAFGAVEKSLARLEKRTQMVGRSLAGAFAGIVSIRTVKQIADVNSEFRQMDIVLRANTDSTEEFNNAQERTREIADQLGVAISSVVDNYGTLAGAMGDLGYTSEQTLQLTETLSKAMALDGMSADQASSAITRFARALQRGELHQARFLLMMEQQGGVMGALAQATGLTIAELRKLSAEGKLSANMLADAMLSMSEDISAAFEEMPVTMERAMQRVQNTIAEAFADEDLMEPVIDSLNTLADTLKDPAVAEGLSKLAAGMATLVGWAAKGAAEFAELGDTLGYYAAYLTGSVSDADKLDHKIKALEKSMSAGSRWGRDIAHVFMSDKEMEAELNKLKKLRSQAETELTGMTEDQRQAAAERAANLKAQREAERAIMQKQVADLRKHKDAAVAAIKERGKELEKAEKEAAKKVADARKEGLDLLQKFDEAIAGVGKRGSKEPEFVDYQKLSVAARQHLAAGDTEKAKEAAMAAVEVLQALEDAGENTYGFQGMMMSMKQVAMAAQEIEQANAEQELADIRAEIEELAQSAAELEDMPIGFELNQAELDQVKNQISSMLDQLKLDAVIPVRMSTEQGAELPGYATGGLIQGAGTGTSDSILARLSNGEYVIKAAAVRKYGTVMLDRLNGMNLPKFATGGLVGKVAEMEQPRPQALGTLNFNLPSGESFSVNTAGDWSDDLRRAALKYGRPNR